MKRPDMVILNRDGTNIQDFEHPITIVLDRLRSAFNVGNIFRLADVCAVKQILTCGYTATPPHPKLSKTALGTEEKVQSIHFDSSLEAVQHLRESGYQTIGIETVAGAPDIWDIEFHFPVAFVFGNEALGMEKETLQSCDIIARLPAYGWKNSLNVANCAAVVVYQAIRQLKKQQNTSDGEESHKRFSG